MYNMKTQVKTEARWWFNKHAYQFPTKLVAGEPAYTFNNFYPHENRDACQCPKRTCFLDEGLVYGTRDGVTALIVPKSTVQVGSVTMVRPVMRPKPRKGKKGCGRK